MPHRLGAGLRTDPLFAGLPDDRCQCAHWGYIISGTMRVHRADGARDYTTGEIYCWRPATTWRRVSGAEYVVITWSDGHGRWWLTASASC